MQLDIIFFRVLQPLFATTIVPTSLVHVGTAPPQPLLEETHEAQGGIIADQTLSSDAPPAPAVAPAQLVHWHTVGSAALPPIAPTHAACAQQPSAVEPDLPSDASEVQGLVCSNCGHRFRPGEENARFCSTCGTRVSGAAAGPSSGVEAQPADGGTVQVL